MITKKLSALLFCAMLMAMPRMLKAQTQPTFDKALYANNSDTLAYRILFPANFDPSKKYALIIILHGSGERGSDNQAQLKYGTGVFLNDTIRQKYPAIVIFPQCPAKSSWGIFKFQRDSTGNKFAIAMDEKPTTAMHALMSMVGDFLDKPYVNKKRVYIGGLSMGGFGTFEIIGRMPKVFAAAFPMCGGDNVLNAKKYAKKVPLWIFHGAKDNTVPPSNSIVMVDAIKAAGGDPKFTLYPNDGHDCWDDAFAEPTLMSWLFSHKK